VTASDDVSLSVTLNNGVEMPQVGLGVARVADTEAGAAVAAAIAAGYRAIDTAQQYGNERGVGDAIRRAGRSRDALFITSKVADTHHGRERTRQAFAASLERLGLDHLDLYVIHWPVPRRRLFVETWLALEHLYAAGLVRAIGVSNFESYHLEAILEAGSVPPAVNQIEVHPHLQRRDLIAVHQTHGITTIAYRPLGKGAVLDDETIVEIAQRRDVTPAQVVLRWHTQRGHVVIPKTITPSRMTENLEAAHHPELTASDMNQIAALERGGRIGFHPDLFG
jgi:2,5-diketo-D-gluconate reductase A